MKYMILSMSCAIGAWNILHAEGYDFPDPYPEVYEQIEVLSPYRYGWYLHANQIKRIFASRDIHTVIEVGVLLGNWTIFIADLLPEGGKIFAVDHWLGSAEHQKPQSKINPLLPTLYQQFLSNTIHYNAVNKVIPVSLDSLVAAEKFKELGIEADMIYIDASHDYDSVLKDLNAWYPILKEEGIFCGDDWSRLSKAVKDFANERGFTVHSGSEFWWYENPKG